MMAEEKANPPGNVDKNNNNNNDGPVKNDINIQQKHQVLSSTEDKNGNQHHCINDNNQKNGQCENNKCFKPVTHIIFDLDGTLIDSEQCFASGIKILLSRYGKEYSHELQQKVLGLEVSLGIEKIIQETGIPLTVKEFMENEREIYREEMLKVELMPGARKLLDHFKKHGIPMSIATGSTTESYGIKTKRYQDLFGPNAGYFQHIVLTRDDAEVKRPKPAPDVYLITAKRFADKPEPERCLVFEDSALGVDGAIEAGMQCIMIPDRRFRDVPRHPKATMVIRSLEEFLPEQFGLPPFDAPAPTNNQK